MPIDTRYDPAGPSAELKAAMVSCTPCSACPSAPVWPSMPEEAMARPVIVQTTIVSKNVPVMLM